MAANLDDVLAQLRAAGLLVDSITPGRIVRCRVEGDREKRGWYALHELVTDRGETLLVGSYGIWRGADSGATKVEVKSTPLSVEQREALRRRLAEDRKRADLVRKQEAAQAARAAASMWSKAAVEGESSYLASKGVGGHGVRYGRNGELVLALQDVHGNVHGLQIIRPHRLAEKMKRPAKEFWPRGLAKRGHFFHIGGVVQDVLLIAEGYATGATLHEATGLPVVVAYDAGNLDPVVQALRKRHKRARILICADDDSLQRCRECKGPINLAEPSEDCPACGKPHQAANAGIANASSAALSVGAEWVAPVFPDPADRWRAFAEHGRKLSDFNDLHQEAGLDLVRRQIQQKLESLRWLGTAMRASSTASGGGGKAVDILPIGSVGELMERFALVYGMGGTVFDYQEHQLLSLSDMRDACTSRELHRAWMEHPERRIVRQRNVGFDPGAEDPEISCNLWGGWPTTPKAGRCEKLLELLRYMCSAEDHMAERLYRWVLFWLAYPLQHPGAKMKTALVLHGPQGTGKNLFFEAYMSIFGPYGRVIDQSAIEDKFNDWASRKLFLIADEVLARSELYHVKNKLKAFITGEWIRINPKGLAAYDERNHVNLVFLSNETMPVVLEEDDRRHAVIWTPAKATKAFYAEVRAEIAGGGVAALHDYLLHLDLGDFEPGAAPPDTAARDSLIALGLDSPSRFYHDLYQGEVGRVTPRPCLSRDLFDLYRAWCTRGGHRPAPLPKFIAALERKHDVAVPRVRYLLGSEQLGPHGVAMLGASAVPDGVSQTTWYGEQIAKFRAQVEGYKGELS